jgi:DNA invertase Pin-like site-specific DNA recombinase
MKIGYARVSTLDQNPDLQGDALQKAECEKIFVDQVSGALAKRPGLEKVKELLRKGDTLVVWRLDRLGRSLRDLIDRVTYLEEHGVGLQSLHENIDTSTISGKLTFHIFGALQSLSAILSVSAHRQDLMRPVPVAAWAAGPKPSMPTGENCLSSFMK